MKHIVLDLDHTLILGLTRDELAGRAPPFKSHRFGQFTIFERPFLQTFLRSLSGYKVSVWTAASQDYGRFIVERIVEPYLGRRVYLFYHADQCARSLKHYGLLKHLDMLYALRSKTFRRDNTLLVDDNPDVLAQNSIVLAIQPFELDPYDAELARVARKIASLNK